MRPRAPSRILPLLGTLPALLLVACDGGGIPSPPVPGRSADGLLDDPELQAVVDFQVARDGEALAGLLSAPAPRVRARAAFALASVRDPETVGPLLEALADPSPRVRADVAFALGRMEYGPGNEGPVRPETVATALLESLDGEASADVRRELVDAIGRVGGPSAIDALARYRDPRLSREIAFALSRAVVRGVESEAAVERVGGGLTHADPGVRMASAYLVSRAPNPVVWYSERRRARLALRVYEKDDPAAMWVIRGLGLSGDFWARRFIPEWVRESPDWRIRVTAVEALGQRMPDVETMELYLDALDDPSMHVHIAAVQAMGEFALGPSYLDRIEAWIESRPADWRTAGHLLAVLALNGREEFVLDRLEAIPLSDLERWRLGIEAMTYLGSERVLGTLVGLLESPHREIATAAAGSLARRWRQDRTLAETHDAYFEIFSRILREADPALVAEVAPAVTDSASVARGSVELLVEAWSRMEDAPSEDRAAVLEALADAGGASVVEVLRDALGDPHPTVRRTAASALTEVVGGAVDVPTQEDVDAAAREEETDEGGEAGGTGARGFLGERIDWDRLRALGPHPLLHLRTEKGDVVVRLDADEAPQTVQTVTELASAGRYDGVPFHRVVPNFVIQGGDVEWGDGSGGPGFRIGTELTAIPFHRGVIGMASSGADTEGSQFFITHSAQPHLDGGYTAFGYVVEGMDVVDRIQIGDRVTEAWVEPDR